MVRLTKDRKSTSDTSISDSQDIPQNSAHECKHDGEVSDVQKRTVQHVHTCHTSSIRSNTLTQDRESCASLAIIYAECNFHRTILVKASHQAGSFILADNTLMTSMVPRMKGQEQQDSKMVAP